MKYFVYVLKNKIDNSRYIGHTQNLEVRLKQHNSRKVKLTKSKVPWYIASFESVQSRYEAIKRELQLKTGFGREWLDQLLK